MESNTTTPVEKVIEEASRPDNRFLGNVSLEHGLLPREAPAESLPPALRFIDDCLSELSASYREGTTCKTIRALRPVRREEMEPLSPAHKVRLGMAYGFLVYSYRYAWEDSLEVFSHRGAPSAEEVAGLSGRKSFMHFAPGLSFMQEIEPNILGPWRELCGLMGRDRSYFETELFTLNFAMRGGAYSGPAAVSQEACDILFRFFGTETEKLFFLGVQEVTAKFNCIPALVRMQRGMRDREHAAVIAGVDELVGLWYGITEDVFMRFDTRLDPIEWSATVGKWTASPFPEQEGFSGMFFPAFHLLDTLIGRSRYESLMGELILKIQSVMPPMWRRLFEAVRAMPLKSYVEDFSVACPELVRALYRVQNVYQHFFSVHRRKVFSFEYQGIVTGRNSTNAGISASVKEQQEKSVYELATWNKIDTILGESARERPFEDMSRPSRCPFASRSLATRSSSNFPPSIAATCPLTGPGDDAPPLSSRLTPPPPTPRGPVSSRLTPVSTRGATTGDQAPPSSEPTGDDSQLPRWAPRTNVEGEHWTGIVLEDLPVRPRVGDRCLLLAGDGIEDRLECDFVGNVEQPPYTVRTPRPIGTLRGLRIMPGVFARKPGEGPRAERTLALPALVLAQGPRCAVATALAGSSGGAVFVVVEGEPREHDFCVQNGLPAGHVAVLAQIEELASLGPSEALVTPSGAATSMSVASLKELRNELIFYVCGDPEFVARANRLVQRLFEPSRAAYQRWMAELRVAKRYRPIVYRPSRPAEQRARLSPWQVWGERERDIRLIWRGKVLDITDFMFMHHGGDNIFRLLAGTDVTEEFARAHPGDQVQMPHVIEEALFHVPPGQEDLLQHGYQVVRSANVLRLFLRKLTDYDDSPYIRTQRALTVILAAHADFLWSPSMAAAFRAEHQGAAADDLGAQHVRELKSLTDALATPDRIDTYLAQRLTLRYASMFSVAIDAIALAMKEADGASSGGCEILQVHHERYIEAMQRALLS